MFRLSELPAVIEEHGMPEDPVGDHEGYEHRPFAHFVEVQLWSDEPIRHLL